MNRFQHWYRTIDHIVTQVNPERNRTDDFRLSRRDNWTWTEFPTAEIQATITINQRKSN